MPTSRRDFLKLSAAGAAATFVFSSRSGTFAAEPSAAKIGSDETPSPLRLLILGGTGYTGPFQVRYALSRGHQVTVFNRGKTHPGELPTGVEQLIGDRNGQLDALKNRQWDVVIDNPTTLPVWVRDAAQILKGNVDRYIFISTISVYSDNSKPGLDENGPLEKYNGTDPMKETLESSKDPRYQLYGPLKALSEQEAEKWFPGQTLVIRPGLIVGPGDESDRFTYWPVRLNRGGPVLAPGAPNDPVQFIDARDLAEWTIRMAEGRQTGIYNATGPAQPFTIGGMLDGIQSGIGSKAELIWVNSDFLIQQGVSPWSDMPVWVPPTGDTAGFACLSIRHALHQGLSVFNLFVVSVFWALMSDTFDTEQAKRLFGLITVGGTLGAIVGAAVTSSLVRYLGTGNLLLFSAALLELAAWGVRHFPASAVDGAGTRLKTTERPIDGTLWSGISHEFRSPYLLGISGYMLLYSVTSTVLYFQQAELAAHHFSTSTTRTAFFAQLDLAVNVLTIIIQCFLTGRLVRWLGVGVTLALPSAISVAGFAMLGFLPMLPVFVILQVLRRAANFAAARPAREVLFTVLSREDKYKAKSFLDTFIYRTGDFRVNGF